MNITAVLHFLASYNISEKHTRLSIYKIKAMREVRYTIFTISLSVVSIAVLFNFACLETISIFATMSENTLDESPAFPIQEITDPGLDWIDMNSTRKSSHGDRSTDIEVVDYYSDGKTLKAILWLYHPFQPNQSKLNEETDYGMLLDADFNKATGFGGIEYKYEIGWKNESKQWTEVLVKWSRFGDAIVLQNQTIDYANFSKKDSHYVVLSLDLSAILSPEKYDVVFYGDARRGGNSLADFTRKIAVPPLELRVTTSPNQLELRKGEPRTVEVRVNTSQGYEPTVNLMAESQSRGLLLDFTQNDTSIRSSYSFRLPSYGIATIPLTISSTEEANVGPNTIFVFANSSFPPEEFIKSSNGFLPKSVVSENIFTQSSFLVNLQEKLTAIDQIGSFWDRVGGPVSFVTGIIIGHVGPWFYGKAKERFRK
jgi:hypothetical protein